ncbi:MAG: response regulator [Desulfobacterales bacterium]|nr:response regulator [Desulfobacterales bacterium]
MAKILIVDDEENVRKLTGEMLKVNGYECALAADASEARKCLEEDNFELILCDIQMPGESGLDLIRYALTEHPETAAVMVTATDDPTVADVALEIGAYDYITKPFGINVVLVSVANALRRRQLELDNRAYSEKLEHMVAERTAALQESVERLQKGLEGSIHAIALTVETRDPYTAGHQQRVANLAENIGRKMGLSEDRIKCLRMAGLTHDLGKIAVPAEILSKPGRISEIEFELIKIHPKVSYDILKTIEFPWPIARIALQHHEKMNGSGYPSGLEGNEIMLEARILAVADVVEAMASHRPYRPSRGIEKASEEISSKKGMLYDPEVVAACLKFLSENSFKFD